ncbi:7435_t:CDS:2 [Ambispora leptoticha]|uniref:7435_t:CDS:1 n=1 Tax=Ambispora leptoticha TaxID=144679 RepID=A0A9N8V0Z8_9GLOM|nr:7435_t:CDS:2 [Ambispora leptoticha]
MASVATNNTNTNNDTNNDTSTNNANDTSTNNDTSSNNPSDIQRHTENRITIYSRTYFDRFLGQRSVKHPPKLTKLSVIIWSFVASFVGIAMVSAISFNIAFFEEHEVTVMVGTIDSPLAQPKNLICGHLISAFIGVSVNKIISQITHKPIDDNSIRWLTCALAVSISMVFMQLTHTIHPPGGATALIAVTGGQGIYKLGYWFMIVPILLGIVLMFIVALLINNCQRRYPLYWWNKKQSVLAVGETRQLKGHNNIFCDALNIDNKEDGSGNEFSEIELSITSSRREPVIIDMQEGIVDNCSNSISTRIENIQNTLISKKS